jgi:hypothetical protein
MTNLASLLKLSKIIIAKEDSNRGQNQKLKSATRLPPR